MIVEFIGSTGTGKTTLTKAVQSKLAKFNEVTTSYNLLAKPLGMVSLSHPTLRNLIQEAVSLPYFIRSLNHNSAYVAFVLNMLARHGEYSFFTFNYLRSLGRTVGMYEIARRHGHDRIILVDEGTLVLAHNIFVYTDKVHSEEEIAHFASLVPLPDLIVHVRAPADVLVERTLRRSDPPRELRSLDRSKMEHYLKRAANIFEQLVLVESVRDRTLTVDNVGPTLGQRSKLADEIVGSVLSYQPAGQPACRFMTPRA